MADRCVATNPAGGRCTLVVTACRYAVAGPDRHVCVRNTGEPLRPGETCWYEADAAARAAARRRFAEVYERAAAVIVTPDPHWYRPAVRLLAALPGTGALSERLDEWRTARAVRRYRARSGA